MNLKQMQERLRALISEVRGIYAKAEEEGRELTDQELEREADATEEMDGLEAKIKEAQEQKQRRDRFEERVAGYAPTQRPIEDGSEDPPTEDRHNYHTWPVEEGGQFFRAVREFGNTRTLPSDLHPDLRETMVNAIEKRADPTGQGTVVDQEGGFLIPSTISSTILQIVHQEGQVVSRCTNVPITVGNSTKWNCINETDRSTTGAGGRYGGITVSRTGENVALTASTLTIKQVSLELLKLTAGVYVTEEQLQDGPQIMSLVNTMVPKAIQFTIEDELINGLGAATIRGLLNDPALVTQDAETGQSAATVVYENIINMWNRIHAPSRSNAVWFINQDVEPQLHQMFLAVGTAGVPVYLPANGVAQSGFSTLMGRPVIPIEHCAALGTVGDIILADMSQFLYATKGTVTSQQSIHVRFLQGETVLRFVLRNDGKGWWSAPLTPAKGTTTRSPFVVLATRS